MSLPYEKAKAQYSPDSDIGLQMVCALLLLLAGTSVVFGGASLLYGIGEAIGDGLDAWEGEGELKKIGVGIGGILLALLIMGIGSSWARRTVSERENNPFL